MLDEFKNRENLGRAKLGDKEVQVLRQQIPRIVD
jgi:hypothetical protein